MASSAAPAATAAEDAPPPSSPPSRPFCVRTRHGVHYPACGGLRRELSEKPSDPKLDACGSLLRDGRIPIDCAGARGPDAENGNESVRGVAEKSLRQ